MNPAARKPLSTANTGAPPSRLRQPVKPGLPAAAKRSSPEADKENATDFKVHVNPAIKRKAEAVTTAARSVRSRPTTATTTTVRSTTTARSTTVGSRAPLTSRAAPTTTTARRPATSTVTKPQLTLREQIEQLNQRVSELEPKYQESKKEAEDASEQLQVTSKEVEDIKAELHTAKEKLNNETSSLLSMTKERDTLTQDLTTTRSELEAAQATVKALESSVREKESRIITLTAEIDVSKNRCEELTNDNASKDKTINELTATLKSREELIEELEEKERAAEVTRRQLHNTIQELKGNIRVFCRVRPLLKSEEDKDQKHLECFKDGKSLEISMPTAESRKESLAESQGRGKDDGTSWNFAFDKVFQPGTSQAKVFEEISMLTQSSLDGYKVCIFAYGQTGSGKTYTMEGASTPEGAGMIPRTVDQIFKATQGQKDWTYTIKAAYLEIYNEKLRDLLASGNDDKKHEIRHDRKGNTTVDDLTIVDVGNPNEIQSLLVKAQARRSVGETKCNERSSRSHSVFQIFITGTNNLTGETTDGMMNLVDLAGSERLNQSKATGERLKETQHINKSLSCLGDVISSLANRDNHVPYRNSKLTYLLQNSLGGNSKTLMFVNISPVPESMSESLCSLRFAKKVNACEIGTARRNTKVSM